MPGLLVEHCLSSLVILAASFLDVLRKNRHTDKQRYKP